jgi:hypothetical protein
MSTFLTFLVSFLSHFLSFIFNLALTMMMVHPGTFLAPTSSSTAEED